MNKTKIDWPGPNYTWNPVTGCKRGCKWGTGGCYAKRNWDRLHRKRIGCEFETVKFYYKRLLDRDLVIKAPCTIFVGSMSDPEYWNAQWMCHIIDTMEKHPSNTFMLLSKNPTSYHDYVWPANSMQGLTMTCIQTTLYQSETVSEIMKRPRPFLSIEPILGTLKIQLSNRLETVIVGAMTGPGAIAPKPEWIQSIKDNVPAEKIYWKNNIKRYL